MPGHSCFFYGYFQQLNVATPMIITTFTALYIIFLRIMVRCGLRSLRGSLCKCDNPDSTCYKAFRAIVVAAARGLFGSTAIKRRDYRKPPCVKVYGKLYTANIFVLMSLLYYTLAVVIVIVLISIGFSVQVSYGLDECSSKVDCFHMNFFDGILPIDNCSLFADVDTAEDVQCYSFLPIAVIVALVGGYITLMPPLLLNFANAVHTFLFESCLKYGTLNKRKTKCISIVFGIALSILPILQILLIIVKGHEYVINSHNNITKFILKDSILRRVTAALGTLIAFLIYPWFSLGQYRQYTEGEEEKKNAECQKPYIWEKLYNWYISKCRKKDDAQGEEEEKEAECQKPYTWKRMYNWCILKCRKKDDAQDLSEYQRLND